MLLTELARQIDAEIVGDAAADVSTCATLDEAQPGQVSFLANPKYVRQLETTRASAVIVAPYIAVNRVTLLKTRDPYFAFRQAVILLHGHRRHPHAGVHPAAHIDPTAAVGENTVVYPGAYVGPRARVGRDGILYPNVVVYDDCVLGDRVTVHAGSVIGTDGYGYATHKGEHHKIPQVGNVIIEDDVEIGANCAIERATIGSTVIGRGTKLCDLVVIGHGAKVGPHCLFVGQVGVAGSAVIGHHVTLAGQVGVAGHLRIGDGVVAAAQSGITGSVPDQATVMGMPAIPAHQARRMFAVMAQLPALAERLKALEQKVQELGTTNEADDDEPYAP